MSCVWRWSSSSFLPVLYFLFFFSFFPTWHFVTHSTSFLLWGKVGKFVFSYFSNGGKQQKTNWQVDLLGDPDEKLLTIVRVFVIRRRRTNLPEKGFQTRHILFKTWWAWQEKKNRKKNSILFLYLYMFDDSTTTPQMADSRYCCYFFFLSLSLSLEKIRRLIFVRSS